jgi:hypothetical protein
MSLSCENNECWLDMQQNDYYWVHIIIVNEQFCKSLSSLLTKKPDVSLQTQGSEKTSSNESTQEIKR